MVVIWKMELKRSSRIYEVDPLFWVVLSHYGPRFRVPLASIAGADDGEPDLLNTTDPRYTDTANATEVHKSSDSCGIPAASHGSCS